MMRLLWSVIAPASVLVPLAIAFPKMKHLSFPLRIFVYYLLFGGSMNVAAILLAKNRINNLPLGHLFTVGECLILCCFYFQLTRNQLARRLLQWLAASFTILFLFNIYFFQDLFTYNSYSRTLEAFLMMVVSTGFLQQQLSIKETTRQPWFHSPFLWITMGLLIYFSGSLFLFFFSEVISRQMEFYRFGWAMHAVLILLLYTTAAIAFIHSEKRAPPPQSIQL
jgi:hypothetical protein